MGLIYVSLSLSQCEDPVGGTLSPCDDSIQDSVFPCRRDTPQSQRSKTAVQSDLLSLSRTVSVVVSRWSLNSQWLATWFQQAISHRRPPISGVILRCYLLHTTASNEALFHLVCRWLKHGPTWLACA